MTGNTHRSVQPIWFLNSRIEVLRASADHADGVSVMEMRMPFGDSPPLHRHENSDEVFHIIEGVVRFHVGDKVVVARAGDTLVGPKGVPHTFRVESAEGARWIVTTRGPDFESMVREFGRPADNDGLPAEVPVDAAMAQALTETTARHHIQILGPPMAAA